ncbi:hypothetical protein GCM10010140_52240 [Streptosporangium pseudovulgare]|uniref:Transposase IS200-like domain-containing protein n=2 Tax=Streptosporangium pseudovulgare TaxID=35765 RepID=A0ABQ2R7X0_9ACTN|nr:hypothetical protein GCM10010140_52240 [Streptosporangium pseudovulgare]
MTEVCDSSGTDPATFIGASGHTHPLVHYPLKVALSVLVKSPKSVSARLLRKEYGEHARRYPQGGHFWSPSCFAASCGGAFLSVVKEYIEN